MDAIDAEFIRYVFLDRDGVLNRKLPEGEYVRRWADFEWLPGAEQAIARMNRAGLTVLLVTNQRGVALGLLTAEQLHAMHHSLQQHLRARGAHLDAIYVCIHDQGQCDCRKPGLGLFHQAMRDYPAIGADNSLIIGDALSDIEAGKRLGMKTVFIPGDKARQKPSTEHAAAAADAVAPSLLAAVERILGLLDTGP